MTLIQLFTAIANAIRAKKGTQASIAAEDFPDEIADITTGNLTDEEYEDANDDLDDILENTTVPSGTISITENGEYDVTNYTTANVNISGGGSSIDWTEIGYVETPYGIIDGINYAKDILRGWDSSVSNVSSQFYTDQRIRFMPLVDTSNATNMRNMFNGCYSLISIPLLDTSNVTDMRSMFYNCFSLTSIPILDTSNLANNGISNMFQYCSLLSNESLNNIMRMCINATNKTSNKTLSHIGLTAEQATICQGLSNYQDFLDAGWTTGY